MSTDNDVPMIINSPASPPCYLPLSESQSESQSESISPPVKYAHTTQMTLPYLPSTRYRVLSGQALEDELERLANPISHSAPKGHDGPGDATEGVAHEESDAEMESISFQPCELKKAANQDRYTAADWMFGGEEKGLWRFAAVFDGHGGPELAEYVVNTLPEMIRVALGEMLLSDKDTDLDNADSGKLVERISSMLRDTIIKLDNQIRDEFINLFLDNSSPENPTRGEGEAGVSESAVGDADPFSDSRIKAALERVEGMSIEEIKGIINDHDSNETDPDQELSAAPETGDASDDAKPDTRVKKEKNHTIVTRVMRGTTALIALVDPARENLWIANLGDCQATLVSSSSPSSGDSETTAKPTPTFAGELITQNHNIDNPVESARVAGEHPGEEGVVVHNHLTGSRVLGAIMVSRALGDFIFKLPSLFTRKVILNASPGLRVSVPVESYLDRIVTPPYISNVAEIHHRKLGTARREQATDAEGEAEAEGGSGTQERYLILSSDGLSDLYRSKTEEETRQEWAEVIGNASLAAGGEGNGNGKRKIKNKALELLRAAIGGEDEDSVSMYLTLERDGRWMDDTTIVVMRLT